ncbi:hypothetical protein SYNPS1DRAFT_26885 [Syncephalis pseudoplumigaleata]|uniref:Protein YOP1 n=1 Tax=Syncephalis pseudoplumigaleata TaxID=1712513 RepID=A0A4P9Z4F0_9FUNG|nr:hypothetical protein SYNPS1DRAFT_26885 [Syncephalis pseudoplumigaleata]|eukprot:RKP27453.1 hypothetical protein SYNPS1DRAFT_26885 [Syncephalis pseudoplumigaleata]
MPSEEPSGQSNAPRNSGGKEGADEHQGLLRVTRRLNAWLDAQQQVPGRRIVAVPRNWLLRLLQRHVITRLAGIERLFVLNPFARLLVYLGFSPVHIFIASSIGAAAGLRWLYRESRGLFLTMAGVIYPVYGTWCLLRMPMAVDAPAMQAWMGEARRWLAYWMVFAGLQLAEHWNRQIQERLAVYHPLKLLLLYWLQCPVARGAERLSQWRHAKREGKVPANNVEPSAHNNKKEKEKEKEKDDEYEPYNVYAHHGDDWQVFKQRLTHELTCRPAWQHPASVMENGPSQALPVQPINYAEAMTEDEPFADVFSSSAPYA